MDETRTLSDEEIRTEWAQTGVTSPRAEAGIDDDDDDATDSDSTDTTDTTDTTDGGDTGDDA